MAAAKPRGGTVKRILVIDDDEGIRRVIRAALTTAGYTVEEATNGKVGLELHRKKPYDLVITDIFMPGGDGLGLIEEVRGASSEIPIVAISGSGSHTNVDGLFLAETLGASKTVRKPFDVKGLVETVKDLLK